MLIFYISRVISLGAGCKQQQQVSSLVHVAHTTFLLLGILPEKQNQRGHRYH